MRFWRSRAGRWSWLGLAALIVGGAPGARAQTLRVRLVDEFSGLPVAGALVSALDAGRLAGQAALSSTDGFAMLRVTSPGSYRVLVRRIGFTPFTSGELRVTGAGDPVVTLVVPPRRVVLAAVRVTARRACDGNAPSPSADAAPLWEEVRKALEASTVSRDLMLVATAATTFERRLGEDARVQRVDTTARGTEGARPFTAQSPAFLERGGYVRGAYRTGIEFFAPDEQVLLSDGFTRRHCVALADSLRRGESGTLVGLKFEPRRDNRLAEIEGTIWVDSASSELKRVEFTYVRAPIPVEVEGLGGHVDFARTGSGAWIVSSWLLRMPRWRSTILERSRVRLDGYTEVGGIARVVREVTALATSIPRHINGTVFDSTTGKALAGARVRLPDLRRDTLSDFLGRFRFEDVGLGAHRVTAEHPAYGVPSVFTGTAEADVVAVASVDVTVGLPSFGTVWKALCGGANAPAADAAIVLGRVTHALSHRADSAATVSATWQARASANDSVATPIGRTVRPDADGRYVACGTSGVAPVTLRATHDDLASTPITVRVGARRVARRDLSLGTAETAELLWTDSAPGPFRVERAAGGALAGLVRDSAGRAIKDARVRLGTLGGEVRTDARGTFEMDGVPPGVRVLSVEAIGFAQSRRVVDVYAGDSAFVDLRLARLTTLAAVAVRERDRSNRLRAEINARVLAGHGYISDSLQLAKMIGTWHAFSRVPATRVRTGAEGFVVEVERPGFLLDDKMNMWCVPVVYIDDIPSGFDQLSRIPKTDIALLEFYNRAANAPLKYTGTAPLAHWGTAAMGRDPAGKLVPVVVKGTCGVVLAWTKGFIRVGDKR